MHNDWVPFWTVPVQCEMVFTLQRLDLIRKSHSFGK